MKFEKIQAFFFFSFLGAGTLLFFWLIGNFTSTIFWAIFFTIVFYPLYKRFLKWTKGKEILSSIIVTLIIIFSILIPVSFASFVIIDQIPQLNKNLLGEKNIDQLISKIPFKEKIDNVLIKNNIEPKKIEKDLSNSIKKMTGNFAKKVVSFANNLFELVLNFFLMIYIIFFGLKDGKKYLKKLSQILPLGDKTEKRLFDKLSSIIRSIFKGTLIISLAQGLLAGLLLYILGLNSVLVWTILLIISAMIPAVGVGLILVPIAIYFFFTGSFSSAIIILIGLLFVSTIDNILRPALIGHETEIPDMLITISILAGLSLIGITGLVIGPVIAGFFLTMWQLFEEKYHDKLDNNL